jgi:hypothetical protein
MVRLTAGLVKYAGVVRDAGRVAGMIQEEWKA